MPSSRPRAVKRESRCSRRGDAELPPSRCKKGKQMLKKGRGWWRLSRRAPAFRPERWDFETPVERTVSCRSSTAQAPGLLTVAAVLADGQHLLPWNPEWHCIASALPGLHSGQRLHCPAAQLGRLLGVLSANAVEVGTLL